MGWFSDLTDAIGGTKDTTTTQTTTTTAPAEKSNAKWWIIGTLIVIAIGVGLYFAFRKKKTA